MYDYSHNEIIITVTIKCTIIVVVNCSITVRPIIKCTIIIAIKCMITVPKQMYDTVANKCMIKSCNQMYDTDNYNQMYDYSYKTSLQL